MAETPKSPGRRLLRKSALQASPFGATIKSFHSSAVTNKGSLSSSSSPPRSQTQPQPQSQPQAEEQHGLPNPFNDSPSPAGSHAALVLPDSPQDNSPSSRKSARLSGLYRQNGTLGSGNSPTQRTPTRTRLMPPTTPKKTKIKTGVWGHIVGLKKQDESEYYRYPIDKSYCSFGRGDTNDIRVQIDAVSDLHCKLIRRDDGEVWLKDTSSDGTLLNDVLLHNTARIILHDDVLTIAGRKFRFEVVAPSPTATNAPNTPGKDIRTIQASVDKELFSLARTTSPKLESRILTTPRRNTARSAAELESSLGLFTPNRAAKLSSLLVSPKPVPLPAFLTQPLKSATPLKSTTPRKTYVMVDEPSILNPSPESETPPDRFSGGGMTTPTREKRKAADDMSPCAGRTPKKVSFGPALSPEVFEKSNPPSTPMKRGQQQDPDTPRRHGVSTPTLLSRLQSVGSVSKPILTPSKLRTGLIHTITKPRPLNLLALTNMDDEYDPSPTEKASEESVSVEPPQTSQAPSDSQTETLREEMEDPFSDPNSAKGDNMEVGSSSPDDGRWKKLVAIQESYGDDADSRALDSLTAILSSESGPDDTDESFSVTPTRPSRQDLSDQLMSTPVRRTPVHHTMASPVDENFPHHPRQTEAQSLDIPSKSASFDNINSFMEEEPLVLDHEVLSPADDSSPSPSPPSSPSPSAVNTERRVHTPIRHSEEDIYNLETARTPGSASRLALLQLSAQKLQGLPDLLQASSDVAPIVPVHLSTFGQTDQDEHYEELEQPIITDEEQESMVQDEVSDGSNDGATADDNEMWEIRDSGDQSMRTPSPPPNTRHLSIFSSSSIPNRRLSAPTSAPIDRSQSPIFTGLRNVFRTPQKVVEFGFASFAGFRNYVRTPTKEITDSTLMESAPLGVRKEDLVANLEVQTSVEDQSGSLQDMLVVQGEATELESDSEVVAEETDSATMPRKQTSHQDAFEILEGGLELSPKFKDSTFVRSQESMFQTTRTLEQIKARGRRSDIFPQRRTMAARSHSYSDDNRQAASDMERTSSGTNRRRTISLTEFKQVASKVLGFGGRQMSETTVASDSSDKENEPMSNANVGQLSYISKEEAEQAELLRLLGEGGSEEVMDSEQVFEQMEMFEQDNTSEDESGDQAVYGGADDAVFVDETKHNVVSTPSSRRSSGVGTPSSKRRQSLKHRLGSSSPAFRRYEHPEDDDEDDEENEDDMVVMISPKRRMIV